MRLPDLEAGKRGEPSRGCIFESFGKSQWAAKGLSSSTKQPAHDCALLGDPFTFSQLSP